MPSVATSDDPVLKAFVAKVRAAGGVDVLVSNYVMTRYNTLIALKPFYDDEHVHRRRRRGTISSRVRALGEIALQPGCKLAER